MPVWDDTLGQTKDSREKLCLPRGLGLPGRWVQEGKTLALDKKDPGCLYFLKRIRFFAICWATVAQQTDRGNRLNKIIRKVGDVVLVKLAS